MKGTVIKVPLRTTWIMSYQMKVLSFVSQVILTTKSGWYDIHPCLWSYLWLPLFMSCSWVALHWRFMTMLMFLLPFVVVLVGNQKYFVKISVTTNVKKDKLKVAVWTKLVFKLLFIDFMVNYTIVSIDNVATALWCIFKWEEHI